MSVYYKFKSAKDYDKIPIEGHFISVMSLKKKIFERKDLGRGKDFDLVVTNAQTNEEYLDEMSIPKNTSVLIRRVPGLPSMPIVTQPVIQQDERNVEASKPDNAQVTKNKFAGAGSSVVKYPDDSEWDDEFGGDLYAIPEQLPIQISNPVQDAPPPNQADEDSKIRALINTPALDWRRQDGFVPGKGYGRGMGGRMMGGRGFGRGAYVRKTPPPDYVCYRCNQPGHFIHHCPTNGDPEFDVKRVEHPTGIPKSMLMATLEGDGLASFSRAQFEKELEGLPSNRTVANLPPELHCPLCKDVMKDAVLTSKCCFTSFCDTCIRDHIINKSVCVCGGNILADDLIPNKTVRDTINRTMERNNSSAGNVASTFQVQDTGTKMLKEKVPSPTHSAIPRQNQASPPQNEESPKVKAAAVQSDVLPAPQNFMEKERTGKVPDVSEAARDSMPVKEHASRGGVPLADDQVQQKPAASEAGKKKKKKKTKVPSNEMQWENPQDLAMGNYMMPMGPAAYNPCWNGMQSGMEGFLPPFGGPMPPFMGYGPGPMEVPFGLVPQYPFGVPSMMMPQSPFPPQMDLAEMVMNREEFEARKADVRRKHEMERSRDSARDCKFNREMSSNENVSSQRPKSKPLPQPSIDDHGRQRHSLDQPSPPLGNLRHHSTRQSPPPYHPARNPDLHQPSSKRQSLDYDRDHKDSHHNRHHHHRSNPYAKSPILETPPLKSSSPPDHNPHLPHSSKRQSSGYDHHKDSNRHHRPNTSANSPGPEALPIKSFAASAAEEADHKHNSSILSRTSFPAKEQAGKRKSSSSEVALQAGSCGSSEHKKKHRDDHQKAVEVRKVAMEWDLGSSEDDDDRYFKRRRTKY